MEAEGDLSERARRRAAELANDADLRRQPPKSPTTKSESPSRTKTARLPTNADSRVPLPATTIPRVYKGETLEVKGPPAGFADDGEPYKSLRPGAKKSTGAKKATAKRKPAAKKVSSADVHRGHLLALRPRVSTSFRPDDLRRAKQLLDDQSYASIEEAARAVVEKALELTRESSKPK